MSIPETPVEPAAAAELPRVVDDAVDAAGDGGEDGGLIGVVGVVDGDAGLGQRGVRAQVGGLYENAFLKTSACGWTIFIFH